MFEIVCRRFETEDKGVRIIAEATHDADLEDRRFGRSEGTAIDSALRGWDRQGFPMKNFLGAEWSRSRIVSVPERSQTAGKQMAR